MTLLRQMLVLAGLMSFLPAGVQAEVEVRPFEYQDQGVALSGFIARPILRGGEKLPAVIVFHDWMGVGEFSKERARRLAQGGYIALAADIYGAGVRPASTAEASTLAGSFKKDRGRLHRRAQAALAALAALPEVDRHRIAAIGFCFGGTTALELARTGAALSGVVSFHGGLETPNPEMAAAIQGRVLVVHGAEDPYVPESEVLAFEKEMTAARVDWQLITYSDAVHAFTNPLAGTDKSKGVAYNPKADRRSYQAMEMFLKEIFEE